MADTLSAILKVIGSSNMAPLSSSESLSSSLSSPTLTLTRRHRLDALLMFSGVQSAANRADSECRLSPVRSLKVLLDAVRTASTDAKTWHSSCRLVDGTDGVVNIDYSSEQSSSYVWRQRTVTATVIRAQGKSPHDQQPVEVCTIKGAEAVSDDQDRPQVVNIKSIFDSISEVLDCGLLAPSATLYSPSKQLLAHNNRKSGCRLYLQYDKQSDNNQPINRLASWLVGDTVRGDVIASDFSTSRLADYCPRELREVVLATIPSALWAWTLLYPSSGLLGMPRTWTPEAWAASSDEPVLKKPSSLLREVLGRRAPSEVPWKLFSKELCCVGSNMREEVVEELLPEGWWTSSDMYRSGLSRRSDKPMPRATHTLLTLNLPECKNLSSASGYSCSCLVPVNPSDSGSSKGPLRWLNEDEVRVSMQVLGTMDAAEQTLSLSVLHLIEAEALAALRVEVASSSSSEKYVCDIKVPTASQKSLRVVTGVGMISDALQSLLLEMIATESQLPRLSTSTFDSVKKLNLSPLRFDSSEPVAVEKCCVEVHLSAFFKYYEPSNAYRPRIFTPPLAEQRRRLVETLLRATDSRCWLDVGCGDGSFLVSCLRRADFLPSMNHVLGMDINSLRLNEARKEIEAILSVSKREVSVELWEGSLLDKNDLCRAGVVDFVSCVEVIEHLPSPALAIEAIRNILESLAPKHLLVSTPNYEANSAIRTASRRGTLEGLAQSCPSFKEAFREEDHKFEFTRKEFREWIDNLLSCGLGRSYDTQLMEVGTRLQGSSELGGATQAVLFSLSSSAEPTRSLTCSTRNGYEWKGSSILKANS